MSILEDVKTKQDEEPVDVKQLIYPGTREERLRYIALRFVPPVITFLWLMLPLKDPSCKIGSSSGSFYTFVFTYFLWYLIVSMCVGWTAYELVVGLPRDRKKMLGLLSGVIVFIPILVLLLVRWKYYKDYSWGITIPASVFAGAIPLLAFFFYHSWLKSRASFAEAALSATEAEMKPTSDSKGATIEVQAVQPVNYIKRLIFLVIILVLFLFTFFICQLFSVFYENVTEEFRDKGDIGPQFLLIVFNLIMLILKAVMSVLGDKLDQAMHNGKFRMIRILYCFISDLFYFFFYRSLFLNVSKYEIFVAIALLSTVGNTIFWCFKISRYYFKFLNKLIDTITFAKESSLTEANYELHKDEIMLDFFFYTAAEQVSLITFTACFAFLFYGYNRRYFAFPDIVAQYDSEYHQDGAVTFITYLPITLFFEFFQVVIVRRYFTKVAQQDAFQLGARYLMNTKVYIALFIAILHISQDVFIARNTFNFCLDGYFY